MNHNKSGIPTLSVLKMNDATLDDHLDTLLTDRVEDQKGLIKGSHCLPTKAKNGRYSVKSTKVCYGYQLVAWKKFGREALNAVPSNKTDRDDLVISHLCGNGRCCNPDHLILEEKWKNDERTHCHFCLENLVRTRGSRRVVEKALDAGLCPHTPHCCTLLSNQ